MKKSKNTISDWLDKYGDPEIDKKVEEELERMTNKEETLEEAALKWVFETNGHKWSNNDDTAGDNYGSFIAGAKYMTERMYTYDELRQIAYNAYCKGQLDNNPTEGKFNLWIQDFKKK
jgi:hypothetical protein